LEIKPITACDYACKGNYRRSPNDPGEAKTFRRHNVSRSGLLAEWPSDAWTSKNTNN